MHYLTHQRLKRLDLSRPNETRTERVSVDFLVNGDSLLRLLVKEHGGDGDLMGCFVQGCSSANLDIRQRLESGLTPDTDEGRHLLYVCPEYGDVGCGAFGVKVRVCEDTVEWYEFAYENGYEPGRLIHGIGPFIFDRIAYNAALEAASAA